MTLTAIRAQTTFEFIGAKIMGVLPRSGYLNPGSGGAVLQVMVANMVVSAKDWVDKSPEYAKVTSVPEISPYFVGLNDRTQSAFDGLVTKVTSAVAQESFDVDVGMRQAGFAFFLLPEVSTSSARRLFSEDLEKMLLISVADINIQSNTGFRYTDPPQGNAVVAASSDLGGLKIGLDGNAKLTVSLSNFDTVYKAGDITLQSNGANLGIPSLV